MNATWFEIVDVVDETTLYALVTDGGETVYETIDRPTARQRRDTDDIWGVQSRDGFVVRVVSMGE